MSNETETNYTTVAEAYAALINSVALERFAGHDLDDVAQWMFLAEVTPEQAAEHYGVN